MSETPRTDDLKERLKNSSMTGPWINLAGDIETELTAANARIAELEGELSLAKFESACMKFQRDALIDITWLDLPGNGTDEECTQEWRELFDAGWVRRDELARLKAEGDNVIDLKSLWEAMPPDVQRKISCHDLKRTVDAYSAKSLWQPIEKAPTDGTVFLTFAPHSQGGYQFACTRSTDERWVCMMSGDQQWPTHYRPLPPAPTDREVGG